jgi:hypothetical protein
MSVLQLKRVANIVYLFCGALYNRINYVRVGENRAGENSYVIPLDSRIPQWGLPFL